MKKELKYFYIENALGWNQDWFQDWWMNRGGCGAVTACDLCIYLAKEKNLTSLYPYDIHDLNKESYTAFSEKMKPYLRPRRSGIDTLEIYIDGLSSYLQDIGVDSLKIEGLHGTAVYSEAEKHIRKQIDCGMLIPFLLLHHKDPAFDELQWHWFNIAGYAEYGGEFYVKAVTYGSFQWLNLQELWDTGHQRKGGIILINIACSEK